MYKYYFLNRSSFSFAELQDFLTKSAFITHKVCVMLCADIRQNHPVPEAEDKGVIYVKLIVLSVSFGVQTMLIRTYCPCSDEWMMITL